MQPHAEHPWLLLPVPNAGTSIPCPALKHQPWDKAGALKVALVTTTEGQTPLEGGHCESATKHSVGDSRPSRPVPSPALPCPRARAVGTSQPAPQLLLHVAAHAAQPSSAQGTSHALRDGYKTQGDGLHPHVQHLADLGAIMAGWAATPTALGTPGLAAATRRQVTLSPPTPPPHPEPRGWGRARLSAEPQAKLPPVQDRCAGANTLKHDGKPWLEIAAERAPQW